ncbi:MAG TPA: proton-conducting transporter membrane subunit [Acidimicrobiales bacterium]|nr:proton-conducting transporter membrane subunit [Acidimicrobiales bacterium]
MVLFLAGLGFFVLGLVAATVLSIERRVVVASLGGSLGCLLIFISASQVLLSGRTTSFHSSLVLPLSGIDLTLDPLAALFVAMTSFVGVATLVYYVGYARGELRTRTALSLMLLFLTALLCVPVASSAVTLMFSWELMALSSMLLIVVEQRRHADARVAAQWYGAMTQLGAASILLGLLLLSLKGGQTFGDIRSHVSLMSPTLRSFAFVLTLIGFASKAGAVPFHVWLPKAHPEAPSPVSALMSSAMVAMGVYGIVRVGSDLLGGGTLWWWIVVVALGVVSALFGALHAVTSVDLKRLLAYSTIDILGLVLIGVGCSGALSATGHPGDARLTLIGALLLVVAHAAFKGCLFLGAGSVERATGSRSLEQLGGLIRRIPITTALFGVGAVSIVAVPAFSGFTSEWLLLQGLLHGFVDQSSPTLIVLLVGVIALALTGGLTAVAFVKAIGVGFLGQARSTGAASAHEVPRMMQLGMGILCVPCVVLGVAPGLVIPLVSRAAQVGSTSVKARSVETGVGLTLSHVRGAIEPMLLLAGFMVFVALISGAKSLLRRPARTVEAWRGGGDRPSARMQYTATSYAEPLQRVFADVLRPEIDVEVTHAVESHYYEQSLSYESRVDDAVERLAYQPVIRTLTRVGLAARRLQNGSVHRYLAFGFIALLIVLVVLA